MNESCLKLTAYFGERQPAVSDGAKYHFLADAMLELFAHQGIATSVMLRGTAGFGLRHVLRTDQSLSLSEDPPVAVAAVDVESKIDGLVDDVLAITSRGLVTLERAHLVDGAASVAASPVVENGDVVKLTIYVGRRDRLAGMPAHRGVCELLHRHGFAGASVFLGVDGTFDGERCRARFFSRNVNVPLMIVSVGSSAQVRAAVAEIRSGLPTSLLTAERVRLCKRDGRTFARPHRLPTTDNQGRSLWQKVMVHTSESTRHGGLPIHRALVQRLRQSGLASGATVLRGIWGFHGDHKPHGDSLFQLARAVPVATVIVDRPEWIARSFDIVDELTADHGLVTCEMVPAAVSLGGSERGAGTELARHDY